jgi:addiction module HigA family antidote
MRAVHPGEVLREEYLVPLGVSATALATALGVPATRIHEIVKERRSVTADTAERLARHLGGDAASWLAMQADYDLKTLQAPTA